MGLGDVFRKDTLLRADLNETNQKKFETTIKYQEQKEGDSFAIKIIRQ
jgi:hypothetical protein